MEESIHYRMQRNGAPGGCWELKRNASLGRPTHWPDDFDEYGTYLYGRASRDDGSYMAHRTLRGKGPQWGLGDHLRPDESAARVPTGVPGVARGGSAGRGGRSRGGTGRGDARRQPALSSHGVFTEARAELHSTRGREPLK